MYAHSIELMEETLVKLLRMLLDKRKSEGWTGNASKCTHSLQAERSAACIVANVVRAARRWPGVMFPAN